jgi:hypothetical protein
MIYFFLLGGLFLLASGKPSPAHGSTKSPQKGPTTPPQKGPTTPPEGISPYEDAEIRKVVAYALAHETDLAVLSNLARLVNEVGYTELAKTIYDRQNSIARARQP